MPRRTQRRSLAGSFRLSMLLALLCGINVYVFFLRPGSSLRDVLQSQAVQGATPARGLQKPTGTDAPTARSPSAVRHVEGKMGNRDTVLGVLRRHGVPAALADATSRKLATVWDPRQA